MHRIICHVLNRPLQYTATRCNQLHHTITQTCATLHWLHCNTRNALQQTTTALCHTATQARVTCRSLQGERDRERERKAERQRDRETERQRDRETERQRDRETERETERAYRTLQYTAIHYNTHCRILQHPATPCNTLQHTATHCNTLQHTAIQTCTTPRQLRNVMYTTLQHTATHCNTLQHTATHCMCDSAYRSLQYIAVHN